MNTLDGAIKSFDNTVQGWLSVVENNQYVSTALIIFLILYAGLAAPKLPSYMLVLFDNLIFKFVIFFLIAYMAKQNPTVAVLSAIALMVTLQALNKLDFERGMTMMMQESENEGQYVEVEAPEEAQLEEGYTESFAEEQIPEESIAELEGGSAPVTGPSGMEEALAKGGCDKLADYRDSFYPQYSSMKPDAYMARYGGDDVGGYDGQARYAGKQPRDAYSGNRKAYRNGRGSYS